MMVPGKSQSLLANGGNIGSYSLICVIDSGHVATLYGAYQDIVLRAIIAGTLACWLV